MQEILGVSAIVIGLIGYAPYLLGMWKGTVKPHAFSWFVWGILTAIAYVAQLSDSAGAGAWVTGITGLVCFLISLAAFRQSGLSNIAKADWYCFIAALVAIPLWLVTKTPLWSVLLITAIDALAFAPTFRKAWFKPDEEKAFTYTCSGLKFMLGIAALSQVTLINSLYPWSLVIMNGAFVAMLIYRRAVLKKA